MRRATLTSVRNRTRLRPATTPPPTRSSPQNAGSPEGNLGFGNVNSPNSIGHDRANKQVYFSSFGGADADLFRVDYSTTPQLESLGKINGDAASGAVYNGNFFYVEQNNSAGSPSGSSLYRIALSDLNDGNVDSGDLVEEFNLGSAQSFGDIAFDEQGRLYGSSRDLGFYEITGDVTDGDASDNGTTVIDGSAQRRQLAFSGGTLFGVDTASGMIYDIDVTTGVQSTSGLGQLGNRFRANDIAPGDIPVPATLGLLGAGLMGLGFFARRRRIVMA
jgi:hypothetical protein